GGKTVRRESLGLEQRFAGHVEEKPEHLVHRQERRGHASRRRHELSATHAQLLCSAVSKLIRAHPHSLLFLGLRHWPPLSVRHDLSGNGGREGIEVSSGTLRQLCVAQPGLAFEIVIMRHAWHSVSGPARGSEKGQSGYCRKTARRSQLGGGARADSIINTSG